MKLNEKEHWAAAGKVWPEQVSALRLNSALFDEILDIDNGAALVLVAVMDCGVEETPTGSVPKITLEEERRTDGAIPVPVRATWSGELDPSDTIVMWPL